MKSKRRTFWRFSRFLIILVVLLLIVLTAIAKIYEDKIVEVALRKVSQSIEAPMGIGDVSFTLIRRFPTATLEFNDVWLGSFSTNAADTSSGTIVDTIASVSKLYVSLKSRELIKQKYELSRIEIMGVQMKYLVNREGVSNLDFLFDTATNDEVVDTSVSTPLALSLEKLYLDDVSCRYFDSTSMMGAVVTIPKMQLSGRILTDTYQGDIEGDIELTNVYIDSTNLFRMQKTTINLAANYINDTVLLKKLNIETDGARLSANGKVTFLHDLYTDLNISGTRIVLGELKKYAPDEMLAEMEVQQLEGTFAFDAQVKGVVSDSVLPEISADFSLAHGSVQLMGYPLVTDLTLNASYTNGFLHNNQTTIVKLKSFKGKTGRSSFDITASAQNLDQLKYTSDVKLKLVLDDFRSLIPDTLIRELSGVIDLNLSTQGQLPDSITDAFSDYLLENTNAKIQLRNLMVQTDSTLRIDSLNAAIQYEPKRLKVDRLSVHLPDYKVSLTNSNIDAFFSGSVLDPGRMSVTLDRLHLVTDGATINTTAQVKNLLEPDYKIKGNIRLNLEKMVRFAPDTLVNAASGKLIVKYASAGKVNFDSLESQMNELLFTKSSFNFALDDISLDMPDTMMNIHHLSGEIDIQPDTIRIDKFKGSYAGIDFMLDSAKVAKLYETIFLEKDALFFEGNIHLSDLDYAFLGAFAATDSTQPDTAATADDNYTAPQGESSSMPQFLCRGKLFISSFTYEKALFENISAKFKLTPTVYVVDQLKFNAFDGTMNTSIRYLVGKNGHDQMFMKNKIDRMDVKKLLADFDNFTDEPSITSEQINGLLSTDLDGMFVLQDYVPFTDSIIFKGDVKLENGGLYNFEPATDLSRVTSIDELDNMKFKTIDSKIFIYKNKMYVPETQIRSNSMDIEAFGMQSFGEDYEYHLRLFPGEVLLGKTKRIRKKQANWGGYDEYDTDGLVTLYLIAYSLEGATKSGIEKEQSDSRKSMLSRIRAQRNLLGFLFQPKLIDFETGVK